MPLSVLLKHFTAAIAIAGLLTACGGQAPSAPPPPEVTVATPLVRQVTDWDEYTGRLAAVESVEIRARVSGYVQDVKFTDGALVKKGDLLFVIDKRPYQALLDEARAQLTRARIRRDLAENDLDRAKRLFEARAVSEEELDARTQVQSAALNLEYCEVRAPISGRISRKLVTEGNLVSGGTQDATLLTTIVSVDPIHVYFTADERAYLRYQRMAERGIRPSSRNSPNPVRIQLADEEGFPHVGEMDFVDNRVDEATGTMQGRAIFPNPEGYLTPGLFARLQLLGEGPYEALLVPDVAIGTDQAQRIVFVLDDQNVATPRPVVLGRPVGSLRVIRKGLEPGDRVIINGVARVRPGLTVTPVDGTIPEPDPRSLGLDGGRAAATPAPPESGTGNGPG
jgi:RND family efflux transporter MFP subunit